MDWLGQDLGEELRGWKGVSPQVLSWQRGDVYCQGPRIWNWRHKGWELGVPPGGEDIHMGRAPEVEQVPCDLLVE